MWLLEVYRLSRSGIPRRRSIAAGRQEVYWRDVNVCFDDAGPAAALRWRHFVELDSEESDSASDSALDDALPSSMTAASTTSSTPSSTASSRFPAASAASSSLASRWTGPLAGLDSVAILTLAPTVASPSFVGVVSVVSSRPVMA